MNGEIPAGVGVLLFHKPTSTMSNHVHFIWQSFQYTSPSQNQASFMNFTARQLLLSLFKDDKDLHASLKVNKYDRDYQVSKREPAGTKLELFIGRFEAFGCFIFPII